MQFPQHEQAQPTKPPPVAATPPRTGAQAAVRPGPSTAPPAQPTAADSSQALVYLQFAEATQRPAVGQLRQVLERNNDRAPSAELVGQVPNRNVLR